MKEESIHELEIRLIREGKLPSFRCFCKTGGIVGNPVEGHEEGFKELFEKIEEILNKIRANK